MERCKSYDPNCPHCQPAMLDMKTGRPLPNTDPLMQVILGIWSKYSLPDRQRWWRVTVQCSEDPRDMEVFLRFQRDCQKALEAIPTN